MTISREQAVKFITNQLHWEYINPRGKDSCFHYGVQDLRELLDFLYGGKPTKEQEELYKPCI